MGAACILRQDRPFAAGCELLPRRHEASVARLVAFAQALPRRLVERPRHLQSDGSLILRPASGKSEKNDRREEGTRERSPDPREWHQAAAATARLAITFIRWAR